MTNKITQEEAEKLFKENGIDTVADGIGNCDIHYVWDDGYGKQRITLGGYCDMEPFKWSVATKWTVGDTKYSGLPWDITCTDEQYTEYCGGEYDRERKGYYWDREYVDLLLEAKKKLARLLPGFKKKTDRLHEKRLDMEYSFTVKHPAGNDKWQGTLVYRGEMYWTSLFDDFMDAKKALDKKLAECARASKRKSK